MSNAAPKSTKQVLKAIGCDKLKLFDGGGYWFFQYDDFASKKLYDTHTVTVMRLRDLSLDQWVAEGRELVDKMEKQK